MTTRTTLTLDEFLRQPETKPASEYACGEVIQKPMPNRSHSAIQAYLTVVLFHFLAQTGLGRVFPEWRCIFGPPGRTRAYVPDLSYASNERLAAGDEHLHDAPDIAIEILSPDQPMGRFVDKIEFYLRHGARLVWVIDPMNATITVLAPDTDPQVLVSGDELTGGDVLPGFSVAVDAIFAQTAV